MSKSVLVTFPTRHSGNPLYPLVVVAVDGAGKRFGQETEVRSVREGIIFGNGMLTMLCLFPGVDRDEWMVNVQVDPRLTREG